MTTDAHLYRAINSIARAHARQVEKAGDFVGPNDMGLSNRLWALAGELRAYGKSYTDRIDHGDPQV